MLLNDKASEYPMLLDHYVSSTLSVYRVNI